MGWTHVIRTMKSTRGYHTLLHLEKLPHSPSPPFPLLLPLFSVHPPQLCDPPRPCPPPDSPLFEALT